MITLYGGIYRVALDLHRRSEEKRRKQETSLATMAQKTVSHLGTAVIGMTRSAQLDAQIMLQQQQVPVVYTGPNILPGHIPPDIFTPPPLDIPP